MHDVVLKQLPQPSLYVPVADHLEKARALQQNRAERALGNAVASAKLVAGGIDRQTWDEFWELQRAAWQRLFSLQEGWWQDWSDWRKYSGQIKGANRMSKLVER